jgi:hypothetical protein
LSIECESEKAKNRGPLSYDYCACTSNHHEYVLSM